MAADPMAPNLKVLLNTSNKHKSKVVSSSGSRSKLDRRRSSQTNMTLTLPKMSSAHSTPRGAAPPSNRTKQPNRLSPVEEEFELHEYEWPDLPPLEQIRAALARGNISQGVRYLLPVDKTKNSVDGKFRTDLRKMFKQQYVNDLNSYDEDRVGTLTRFHFSTNTIPTDKRPKTIQLHPRDVAINHESNKARLAYCQSAPANGLVGSRTMPHELKARSSLNFPLKQKIPEEARKLKEEADRILKSVQEKEPEELEYDPNKDNEILNAQGMNGYRRSPDKRRPVYSRLRTTPNRELIRSTPTFSRNKHRTDTFGSYDELKNYTAPKKRDLPPRFKSRYLSGTKTNRVWDWLNEGEKITDFSYFLEVCS